MSKLKVTIRRSLSRTIEVDAETPEKAKEKAYQMYLEKKIVLGIEDIDEGEEFDCVDVLCEFCGSQLKSTLVEADEDTLEECLYCDNCKKVGWRRALKSIF